jgi:hypothetical protein
MAHLSTTASGGEVESAVAGPEECGAAAHYGVVR